MNDQGVLKLISLALCTNVQQIGSYKIKDMIDY